MILSMRARFPSINFGTRHPGIFMHALVMRAQSGSAGMDAPSAFARDAASEGRELARYLITAHFLDYAGILVRALLLHKSYVPKKAQKRDKVLDLSHNRR